MDIDEEYSSISETYQTFLRNFSNEVSNLLQEQNISLAFSPTGRMKSIDSVHEKLETGRHPTLDSLSDLNDLVGIRIVLLFPEVKDQVVRLLSDTFDLLNDPGENKQHPDKFGYSSIHLILRVKKEWSTVPTWSKHLEKKIEVQVRTLSEHIWAETSHALFYKREENIPNALNRDLHKMAAVLEVIDDQLQNIKSRVEKHFADIREASFEDVLNLDLNSETFRRVMDEHSNGIYNLNDLRNKILSSKIEREYNILNVNLLDKIISGNIDTSGLSSDQYVEKVIELLDRYIAQSNLPPEDREP